jgi:hypothetical protein
VRMNGGDMIRFEIRERREMGGGELESERRRCEDECVD